MNMSIECNVKECKYHSPVEKYCTLNHICVDHTSQSSDADCTSFEKA